MSRNIGKNMKPIIILSTIAIAAAALIYLTIDGYRDFQALKRKDIGADDKKPLMGLLEAIEPEEEASLLIAQENDHLLTLRNLDLSDGELMQSAWQVSNNNVEGLEQQIAVEEYKTVEFNQTMYLDIGKGDDITLELPTGESLVVSVTSEQLNDNGDFTWQGEVTQDGQTFPVVMTQGEFGTYGSIATKEGTFTVTTTAQGVGVIYKNPPLPHTHQDDFLEVPIHTE